MEYYWHAQKLKILEAWYIYPTNSNYWQMWVLASERNSREQMSPQAITFPWKKEANFNLPTKNTDNSTQKVQRRVSFLKYFIHSFPKPLNNNNNDNNTAITAHSQLLSETGSIYVLYRLSRSFCTNSEKCWFQIT